MEKILYVATYGDFFASFLVDNMKMWQKFGCEVHCAANFNEKRYNRYTNRIDEIGVIKHEIDFVRTPYSSRNIQFYRELVDIIKKEKITVVDCHNPVPSFLARFAAKKCDLTKVIYTVHGFFFYKGALLKNQLIYKPIEYAMARLTDYLIVTNHEDYEAAKKMKVRGSAFYVHGVGVDVDDIMHLQINRTEKRREFLIPSDAIVLCSVGENIKRKNHEMAIRAFAKIDKENFYYIIVGDGEIHEYLRNLARELNVENKVIFTGYRTDANDILKISDIYVFPSYQEGLSVALMQAMAAGLPVVTTRIRGNIDCIEDNMGGFTIEVDHVDEMAQAIEILMEDVNLRVKFGKYNTKKVELFSKEFVSKENFAIFSTILNGK